MVLFLENLLQERSTSLKRYLSETDGVLLCRCYPAGSEADLLVSGDRIF